jgi:hypothetical protein
VEAFGAYSHRESTSPGRQPRTGNGRWTKAAKGARGPEAASERHRQALKDQPPPAAPTAPLASVDARCLKASSACPADLPRPLTRSTPSTGATG